MRNTVKFAGTSTFVTQIVQGSFHYSASVSNPGELRLGGIFSASIEFDYYTSNGITVNVGDVLQYIRTFPGVNTSFEEVIGTATQNKGTFNVTSVENRGETCHVIAYDDIIKLDVSFSERLKQLESSFPMSLHDLLDEVISVSGVPTSIHETQTPISQFWAQNVMYFYSDSITCRNIYEWIAELRGFPLALDTSVTPNKIANRPFGWNRQVATNWPSAGAYIICPDDGTYTVPYDPSSPTQAIDVWYKENGLSIGKPITSYDGVEILWPGGAIIGYYYGVQTPTKIYRVKNNILFNYILLDGTQVNPDSIAQNIYNRLADLATCVSGTVALFPFRYPFTASALVGVVDAQGNQYKMPVMREDFTDNGVIIEAFANDYDNTSVSNSFDTQENKTVSLDVRVTDLESKVDGIYPNFKIYNSVTQLGLTSGSATIAGAYSALSKYEMLICPAAEFSVSEVPSTSGCMVEMVKRYADGSAGRIVFWGRTALIGDYRMFVGNSPFAPTGVWVSLEGQAGALPNNTDLNTVTTPGTYLIDGNNTYTNSPTSYGTLECISHRNDRVYMQRITNLSRIYWRYATNTSTTPPQWGSWYYVAGTQV